MATSLSQQGTLLADSTYGGSIRLYAAMLCCSHTIVDASTAPRRHAHAHNRMLIAGPNGTQMLTVPVEAHTILPHCSFEQAKISEQVDWRRMHWGALYSAYGKSPFFDYIAPDIERLLLDKNITSLLELNTALHNLVVDFLDLPISTTVTTEKPDAEGCIDLRGKIDFRGCNGPQRIADVPYYQVWQSRHGFIPGLSILDLLFHTGREAIFTLIDMGQSFHLESSEK